MANKTEKVIRDTIKGMESGFQKTFGEKLDPNELRLYAAERLYDAKRKFIENRLGDFNADEVVKLDKIVNGDRCE